MYTPDWSYPAYGITKGRCISVHVLGLFPVATEDSADACFVIELPSGQCMYTGVGTIRFTDVYGGETNDVSDCN